MKLAWDLAGLTMVCKTVRKGFDSLPRLHIYWERPRSGVRFPCDLNRIELVNLVYYHHRGHADAATEAMKLRERLIEAQKELSKLKRLNRYD